MNTVCFDKHFVSARTSRLLVIDPAVVDYQQLFTGLRPGYEVLVLDGQCDGMAQISERLARSIKAGRPLESLHVLSHGSPGTLYLGESELSLKTLAVYGKQLEQWGAAVDALVLYGCNVAAGDAGAEFIQQLHRLTGARIAASATKTGSAQLGGDWQLTVQLGEAQPAAVELAFEPDIAAAYGGVLAMITVNTTLDEADGLGDGEISLRDALIEANSNADFSDTIILGPGTFTLSLAGAGENAAATGDLDVTSGTITIRGAGEGITIIDGASLDRVFEVLGGAQLILDGVTVTGGNSVVLAANNGNGGGIFVNGFAALEVFNSRITNNQAQNIGGGIVNQGTTTLTNSTVSNNRAIDGGGLFNTGETALTSSTISGNQAKRLDPFAEDVGIGGGIFNQLGRVISRNSTISGNQADSRGGGIANSSGIVNLINSTVSGNRADFLPTDGIGGGIHNDSGTVTLANSIVAGNRALIVNEIFNFNSFTGTVNSNGNNLLGDSGQTSFSAFLFGLVPSATDITATSDGNVPTPLAAILGPLADNGGPTQTHALPSGSPAIDAGNNADAPGLTDQRGALRIVDSPDDADAIATVDIGAFEECFLTGTRITTDRGEIPVETLQIGDRVKTADGSYQPVKWVGHQTFDRATKRPHPFRTYPICIQAGALGNNLPLRDLYVSPDHAILVDGLLINAGALTNDTSIIQVEMERFVYHHIELEQHSLLLAEGSPAESYLPQNQARTTFDNGAEYEQLYPNHNILSLLPMSFPRVSSKRQLPRCIRKKLMAAAETLPQANPPVLV